MDPKRIKSIYEGGSGALGSEQIGTGIPVYLRHKVDYRFESPCDIKFVVRKETFHRYFFLNIHQFLLRIKLCFPLSFSKNNSFLIPCQEILCQFSGVIM